MRLRLNGYRSSGFTIIEVMIVLSIMGLMLVGFMASASSQVNQQRERDAVQDFASWLQGQISEVLYPSPGGAAVNADGEVILGRLIAVRPNASGSTEMTVTAYPITSSESELQWGGLKSTHCSGVITNALEQCNFREAEVNVRVGSRVAYEPKWRSTISLMNSASGSGELQRGQVGFDIMMIRNPEASEISRFNIRANSAPVGNVVRVASRPSGANFDSGSRAQGAVNPAGGNFFGGLRGLCINTNGTWTTISLSFRGDLDGGTGGSNIGAAGTDIVRILNRDSGGNICQE